MGFPGQSQYFSERLKIAFNRRPLEVFYIPAIGIKILDHFSRQLIKIDLLFEAVQMLQAGLIFLESIRLELVRRAPDILGKKEVQILRMAGTFQLHKYVRKA